MALSVGIDWKRWLCGGVTGITLLLFLGVVCVENVLLPAGILVEQWKFLYLFGICGLAIGAIGVCRLRNYYLSFLSSGAAWCFILLGAVEAVWGLRQVYGFTYSNHSLFALTGSFYNPGPYSGYLAMVFPVCLYEWLRRRGGKKTIPYYIALSVVLLIICVLPAGMSRSAWIAAAVSSAYIAVMHFGQAIKDYIRNHRKRVWVGTAVAIVLGAFALGGIYLMKKDSADGRLFMWKVAARAVAERPWDGYGWDAVAAAYGQAQETYFETGSYTETEEHVAGTPEYVFNEYLQVAMAWGIPALCIGLLVIGGSIYAGTKRGEYGLCGGLISLAVFAFSSYPLQFPGFVAALVVLVVACSAPGLPFHEKWFQLLVLWLSGGVLYICMEGYEQAEQRLEACRKWNKSRMFYRSGAYGNAAESYAGLYEEMKWNARFLFEYGHALHKQHRSSDSNKILKEALKVSGDPMILNIIGKNEQDMKNYERAEEWLLRSTRRLPGRIYPYYLLTKLYADPHFYQPEKIKQAGQVVLIKEPKVQSTAIKEMRKEVKKIMEKL
ncbi:O-antigen ligase family protein [Phocaeicola sp.]